MQKERIENPYIELMAKSKNPQELQTWPYGFKTWMNQIWQVGQKMKIWDFDVFAYRERLCYKSWLVYFMAGLSPINAISQDIKEGGE